MRIPATCVTDAPLYAGLIGPGGLLASTTLPLSKGAMVVEVVARPIDLPYGAFARLVRDRIDPMWGAQDADPEGYWVFADEVERLGQPTEIEDLISSAFKPDSASHRVARAIYDEPQHGTCGRPLGRTLDTLAELAGSDPDFDDFYADDEDGDGDGETDGSAPVNDVAAIADAVKQTPSAPSSEPTNVTPIPPTQPPAAPAQPQSAPPQAIPKGNTLMQFTIDKGPFLSALKRVVALAAKKSAIPILECVLLDVSDTVLALSASDMAVDVRVTMPISIGAQPGRLAVPGAALATAIDALPDGAQITLEAVGATADGVRLRILCGKTRFHLPTRYAEDFPVFAPADGAEMTIPASALKQAIDRVVGTMCTDDTKPNLMGMAVHALPEGVRVVTSNVKALSRADLNVSTGAENFVALFGNRDGFPGVLIPSASVAALRRLLDVVGDEIEARLVIGQRRATFDLFPFSFGTTLSAVAFAPYERVISHALGIANKRMTIPRGDFLASIRRVRSMADDKDRALALTITAEGVRVETAERGSADAVDVLETDTGFTFGSASIGFSSKYLVPAVEALNASSLSCEMGSPDAPTFWRAAQEEDINAAEHLIVVMPYRLSKAEG
ncbi:DNA polymerase III subunit beta [Azospirillum cavernae]|uniref:Beta sliding clamp n=1 Tax=Azospirillum cavernae TaxID=2320860 RepID=A0A418VWZ6_9PROT|nr:DNA polymerase III subunit beta [Azospirillum cavernae]RJF81677.1 DNA polymerase III subunit beta [Azospirillum cavernae]RJF82319.1 DNA polymerase III subunit beta [Azospirillum cavernae]